MLRYFVIATILVVGTAILITASYHRLRIEVGAGRGTIAPKPAPSLPRASGRSHGLRGDAPWALSALPECLIQVEEWKGALAVVRAHLPRAASRIIPPATLRFADCTLRIFGAQAFVTRSDTNLRIPPYATFYRVEGGGLVLVRASGCKRPNCPAVLRVYATPGPSL